MAGVNVNLNVDVVAFIKEIREAAKTTTDRQAFVRDTLNRMKLKYPGSNIMVFNLGQDYTQRFKNIKFYDSFDCGGCKFGVWAFEDGTFINKGEGGWENWGFSGIFRRSGDYGREVKFHKN
ncbi:unnamed protein product [Adineta ricciae]|uniref:Uncharacterized protein n=1 Tax=Adineta ricciae TaxID=249248 RepID=A0A815JVW5_ADIRI|nr:unnamed protein product [Adineta ricciae]CAF1598334.1 unnamed protein product [Adineta ricciae]